MFLSFFLFVFAFSIHDEPRSFNADCLFINPPPNRVRAFDCWLDDSVVEDVEAMEDSVRNYWLEFDAQQYGYEIYGSCTQFEEATEDRIVSPCNVLLAYCMRDLVYVEDDAIADIPIPPNDSRIRCEKTNAWTFPEAREWLGREDYRHYD